MRRISISIFVLLAACSGANRDEPDLAGNVTGEQDLSVKTSDLMTVGGPVLVINEAFPHGTDELTDPDWIELKNVSGGPVSLSGYTLADDAMTAIALPDVVVLPGGYALILADDAPDGGAPTGVHVPWKLGKADSLTLKLGALLADSTSWLETDAPAGKSWARLPDGNGSFATATPTKLAVNAP